MAKLKSALMKRDQYAGWQAASIAAEIIVSTIEDAHGPTSFVLEAAGASAWDDIEIQVPPTSEAQNGRINWQIKRQTTDIDQKAINELLVEANKLLTCTDVNHICPDRLYFGFSSLQSVTLGAKKKLQVDAFVQLSDAARRQGFDPAKAKTESPGPQKAWWDHIESVLGTTDVSVVANLFRHLHFFTLGTEEEIQRQIESRLERVFKNPKEVCTQLHSYLINAPDGRIVHNFNALQIEVVQKFGEQVDHVPSWIRFNRKEAYDPWRVCGTLVLQNLARNSWLDNSKHIHVKVNASPNNTATPAELAISRLIAHQGALTQSSSPHSQKWFEFAEKRAGGTLGNDQAFEKSNRVTDLDSSGPDPEGSDLLSEELGEVLSNQMNELVFQRVCKQVPVALDNPRRHLRYSIDQDLSKDMAKLWNRWKESLSADDTLRKQFLQSTLSTCNEWSRELFCRDIRVGEQNVDLIVRALVASLAIGVALNSKGADFRPHAGEGTANFVIADSYCHLLALARCSINTHEEVADIDAGLSEFLNDENGFTIATGTKVGAQYLVCKAYGTSHPFDIDAAAEAEFIASYTSTPLITAENAFWDALEKGLEELNIFLGNQLKYLAEGELNGIKTIFKKSGGQVN